MTAIEDYRRWLIYHMRMKIQATRLIQTWHVDPQQDGFIEALTVMIEFVGHVDPLTHPIPQEASAP